MQSSGMCICSFFRRNVYENEERISLFSHYFFFLIWVKIYFWLILMNKIIHSKRAILFLFIPQSNRRETWWMLCIAEQNQRGGVIWNTKAACLGFCLWKGHKLQKAKRVKLDKRAGSHQCDPPPHLLLFSATFQHAKTAAPQRLHHAFLPHRSPTTCVCESTGTNVEKISQTSKTTKHFRLNLQNKIQTKKQLRGLNANSQKGK